MSPENFHPRAEQIGEAGDAPAPTRSTLFWRTFVPWQIVRFFWINLKMFPRAIAALPSPGATGDSGTACERPW